MKPGEELGRRVREIRQKRGLTQGAAAERAGMTPAKWSDLENGVDGGRGPTLSRLYQVATALNVLPHELLR